MRSGLRGPWHFLRRALIVLVCMAAVWLTFVAALWASHGALRGYVALLLSVGVAAALWWFGTRRRAVGARVRRAVAMVLALAPLVYLMVPLASDTLPVLPDDPTIEQWATGTGREVAVYRYRPAAAVDRGLALVFVHGGPGGYVRDFDRDFFAQFASDGFDVVLYDQFGAGASPTGDVRGYTHENNISDLAAVLRRVGKPVVLVGQSYGATLITSALSRADVREHVKYVALSEPGKLPGAVFSTEPTLADKTTRAPDGAQPPSAAQLAALAAPRALLATALPADQRYVAQEELINLYTPDVQRALVSNAFCKGDTALLSAWKPTRFNLLANTGVSRTTREAVRPDLRQLPSPVLLLLGECSYIPRGRAMEYFDVYRIARSHAVPGVGHILWGNERGQRLVRDALVAFVTHATAPLPNEPTLATRDAFVEAGR